MAFGLDWEQKSAVRRRFVSQFEVGIQALILRSQHVDFDQPTPPNKKTLNQFSRKQVRDLIC